MEYWLGRLKSLANTGDILALQMVYCITGEVLMEGYTKAVSNTADNFFAEDGNKAVTAIQNKKNINDSVMEKIKAPFVEGVEGLMFDLYGGYQAEGNTEEMADWLGQLKRRANEGNVPALRIVYHITGEVLPVGLDAVVSSKMDNLFTEGREQGVSHEITTTQNREQVRNNIVAGIKAPFGTCKEAF